MELKSVAINRARPHQMAVAAGDSYLRLYDRRMLSLTQPSGNPPPPVLALAPPHLSSGADTSVLKQILTPPDAVPDAAVGRAVAAATGALAAAPVLRCRC